MAHGNLSRRASKSILPLALLLAIPLAGCGGEDALAQKSKTVMQQTMAASPDHAAYGVALAIENESPHAVELITEMIASENFKTARQAIQAIVDDPPAQAEPALRNVYETKRGLLKLDAAIALARLGDAEALAWVSEECLASNGQSLTKSAVKLLAANGEEAALTSILTDRMANREPSLRNEAYVMLGSIGQDWATTLLMKGLDNEAGEERAQAILSLGETGDPRAAKKLEKFVSSRGLVFATLESLGSLGQADSAKALSRQLKNSDPQVKIYAAAALWKVGQEEQALEVLEPMTTGEDPALRLAIAQQLRGIESAEAQRLLSAMVEDEDAEVRLSAMRSLAVLGLPDYAPMFLAAAGETGYQTSTLALDALSEIGGPDALPVIEPLLENRNPYVAMSAANAILAIQQRSADSA